MDVTAKAGVELVVDARAELGEGPVWDDETRRARVGRHPRRDRPPDLAEHRPGRDVRGRPDRRLGRASPGRRPRARRPTTASISSTRYRRRCRRIAAVEEDDPLTRMNDGKVDPQGRFWAGTMAFDEVSTMGSLYRLDPDGTRGDDAHRGRDLQRDGLVRRRFDDVLHRHAQARRRHVPLGRPERDDRRPPRRLVTIETGRRPRTG